MTTIEILLLFVTVILIRACMIAATAIAVLVMFSPFIVLLYLVHTYL